MEACGEGSGTQAGAETYFSGTLSCSQNVVLCTPKKQVEVEKGANRIWRVNGRYLNPKVSFALSSLFYFLLFIPFFLQESVLNF